MQDIKFVYVNGNLVTKDEAKINCFDEGITHGWAVYEGIRVYKGKILKIDEHIDRLYDSAKAAYIKIPISKDELKKAIIDTVKANGFQEAHIRPWASYGEIDGTPNIFIQAKYAKTQMGKKSTAIVSAIRRAACDAIDSKIKTNSRLDLCLAKVEAQLAGADFAIMLDKEGFVAEVSMANIFIVKKEKVFTPFTTNALEGITRELLIGLLKKEGYQVKEKNMTFKDLYTADEIFVCGTGAEIKPIIDVDGRTIGDGDMGSVVKKAIELYWKYIEIEGTPIY